MLTAWLTPQANVSNNFSFAQKDVSILVFSTTPTIPHLTPPWLLGTTHAGFFPAVFLTKMPYLVSSSSGVLTTSSFNVSQIFVFSLHFSSRHQSQMSNSGLLNFPTWIPPRVSQIIMTGLVSSPHVPLIRQLLLLCSLAQWRPPACIQLSSPEISVTHDFFMLTPNIGSDTTFYLSKSLWLMLAISCALPGL